VTLLSGSYPSTDKERFILLASLIYKLSKTVESPIFILAKARANVLMTFRVTQNVREFQISVIPPSLLPSSRTCMVNVNYIFSVLANNVISSPAYFYELATHSQSPQIPRTALFPHRPHYRFKM